MTIPLEPLLALRAFRIGLEAEDVISSATVLFMLNHAIGYLGTQFDDESVLRLAFYPADPVPPCELRHRKR